MSDDDNARQFEILKIEYEWYLKQFTEYVQADQRIVAAMATLVVAIIGVSVGKIVSLDEKHVSYVLFLASFLMSLAINQSCLYSALCLFSIERRYQLAAKIGALIGCDPDFALSHGSLMDFASRNSYGKIVLPYYAFKASIGILLTIAGAVMAYNFRKDHLLQIALIGSAVFALWVAAAVIDNARTADAVIKQMAKSKAKQRCRRRWMWQLSTRRKR